MKAVIQRVESAQLFIVEDKLPQLFSSINQGIVALLAIEQEDSTTNADKMLHTIINYRVFSDDAGKMALSLADIQGELMLVSQFTVAADTRKGLRPNFSPVASPDDAKNIFDYIYAKALESQKCQQIPYMLGGGVFGAMMKISLINDGPVTFILNS